MPMNNCLHSLSGGLAAKGYIKSTLLGKPLVTIIISVMEGGLLLERTILSVLSQTYDNIELVIIDGGSTSKTIDILKKYDDQVDLWISERDNGIYDAWNKGLVHSSGKWIVFLGCGDSYYPSAISDYLAFIHNTSIDNVEYVSSKVALVNDNFDIVGVKGKPWCWDKFKKQVDIAHVGSLHSRNLFDKYGFFDDSYKIAGDYEFLLRPQRDLGACYINQITAEMLLGGLSFTSNKVYVESFNAKYITGKRNLLLCCLEISRLFLLVKIKNVFISSWSRCFCGSG